MDTLTVNGLQRLLRQFDPGWFTTTQRLVYPISHKMPDILVLLKWSKTAIQNKCPLFENHHTQKPPRLGTINRKQFKFVTSQSIARTN